MEISEEKYNKVERYLKGEMPKKERDLFEMNLKTDSQLKNNTEELSALSTSIKVHSFAKDLGQKSKQFENSSAPKRKWIYMSGIAASVLIILLFGLFQNYKSNQVDSIFENHFTPYPYFDRMRNNQEMKASKAFMLYEKASYGEAALLFESIDLRSNADSTKVRFYKGISYLANRNPSLAIRALNDIQYKNAYSQQIHWYLALSYIELEDFKKAQNQLKQIADSSVIKKRALEVSKLIDDK